MTLSTERWRIVKALFQEVMDLPAAERAVRLAEAALHDPESVREVEALVTAAHEVGDRFERVPLDFVPPADDGMVGEMVGPYRIVREIGRGGMGAVYEAHRADDAYQKRVALKTVRSGLDTDAILRRFRFERQILARLEHRNIATLLDGGITVGGQPYFVMEYVEGERIDHYCRAHQLGIADRLRLVRQVCAALQYAHQHLVVHRDVKPGNILVAGDGTVKLVDFGIAKLLDPSASEGEDLTQTGAGLMTTAYASPEQLGGKRVTTASDIYSLGAVLYELLVGRAPHVAGDLPVLELRRRILETAPVPPSQALTTGTTEALGEPTTRRAKRAMAGELDNIVLMALRKEPERRYPSVEALADDLLCYLSGLPIRATPDTMGYRLGKLVRRNRMATAAMVVALVAVIVGALASLQQARVARAERDRATQEQAKAQEITSFFQSVFSAASPARLGREVTVVEAIEAAIPRIDTSFADRPELLAALKGAIGSTFFDMELYQRAEPLAREALALHDRLDGGGVTEARATARYNLAMLEHELGNLDDAERLYAEAMGMYEALPGYDPADLARGYGQMALLHSSQGRQEESARLQGQLVGVLRARVPRTDRGLAVAIANYASALSELGRLAEAEPLHREAVAILESSRGADDPTLASVMQPLAMNLLLSGHLVAAESVARRSHQNLVRTMGPTNPRTMVTLRALGTILLEQGRCPEVLTIADEILALRGTTLPDTDLSVGTALILRGECLGILGRGSEGEAAVREGLRLRMAVLPETHWAVAVTNSILGELLARQGRAEEGRALLESSHAALMAQFGADHPRTLQARRRMGVLGDGSGTGPS